jgi:uncharacterized protein YjbJ (UPF0337 family)
MTAYLLHHTSLNSQSIYSGWSKRKMNSDQIKGKLKQLQGEIKRSWGQIIDNDVTEAEGSLDKLVGKIQERSGDQREAIEKWFKSHGLE